MKKFNPFSFRRKTLLRAVQAAVAALLLWLDGQNQAAAATYSAPFNLSGSTITTTSGTYSGGDIGFYDPANPYTLTIAAGTSITSALTTGYGSGADTQASPYAVVTLGGGTFVNAGSLLQGTSNSPLMVATGGTFADVALGSSGSASVDNSGTLSSAVSASAHYQTIVATGLSFYSPAGSLTLTNESGATISGTASGAYGTGYGINAVSSNGAALTILNHGTVLGTGTGTGTGPYYQPGGSGIGTGIAASSTNGGAVTVTNTGSVVGTATGIGAYDYGGDGTGTGISVTSYSAYSSTNAGALLVFNTGTATGSGTGNSTTLGGGSGTGMGINATAVGYAAANGVTVINQGNAFGTGQGSNSGYSAPVGIGINATSTAWASSSGPVTVLNSGGAFGIANASSYRPVVSMAAGIEASSLAYYNNAGSVNVTNSGGISGGATASSALYSFFNATANGYGIQATSTSYTPYMGYGPVGTAGTVGVLNNGVIFATATDSGYTGKAIGTAYGIDASSTSAYSSSSAVAVVNGGGISAVATGSSSFVPSINPYFGYGISTSSGTSTAYGIYASSAASTSSNSGAVTVVNSGTVSATATNSGFIATNTAVAYGIYASSTASPSNSGAVTVVNSGTVSAAVSSSGITTSSGFASSNSSVGYGIYASSGLNTSASLSVTNTGTVTASGTTASGSTASYGIYLGSVGTVYNTGTVTGGTAAISVPGGSSVTLAGYSVVNGLMVGGSNASSISQIHFNLTLPQANLSAAQASLATAQANLAADNTAGTPDSVLINGQTYRFIYFGLITDSFVVITPQQTFAQNFSQVAPANSPLAGMAHSLSTLPSGNASTSLLTSLNAVPMNQIGAALNQLTPSKTSVATTSAITSNTTFENSRLNARLEQVNNGLAGSGMDWSGLSVASADDPLLGQLSGQLLAYNPSENAETPTMSDTVDNLVNNDVVQGPRWGTFLTGNAILADQDGTATQARVDSTTVGVTGGIDYRIDPHWTAGIYLGYGRTTANLDSFGSRSEINDYRMGPYAGYHNGNWWSNAHASFGLNQEENARAIPVLGTVASSNPDGTQYDAGIDGGYDFHCGKLTYGPTTGLQYTHLSVNGYTETGAGAADLTVDPQQADSLLASLGGQVSYDVHWNLTNTTFRPQLNAAWQHECLNNSTALGAAFAVPGSASFTTALPNVEKDSALLGGAANLIFSGGSLLFIQYEAQVQPDYLAQSITGGLRIPF